MSRANPTRLSSLKGKEKDVNWRDWQKLWEETRGTQKRSRIAAYQQYRYIMVSIRASPTISLQVQRVIYATVPQGRQHIVTVYKDITAQLLCLPKILTSEYVLS